MSKIKSSIMSLFYNDYGTQHKTMKPWIGTVLKLILLPIIYITLFYTSYKVFGFSFHGSVLFSSIITYISFITYLCFIIVPELGVLYFLLVPFILGYYAIVEDIKNEQQQHKVKPSHIIKDSTSVSLIHNGVLVTTDKIEHYNNPNLYICYDSYINGFEDTNTSSYYVCK